MSKVVNLRQVRKRKSREDARQCGDRNAVKFGRTRHERTLSEAEAARAERVLDGKKREDDR